MNLSNSVYTVSHCWALGIPGVGEVLYEIQWVLLKSHLLHHVWVSRRQSVGRVEVITLLKQRASRVVCTSLKLSEILKNLPKIEIVFAVNIDQKPMNMLPEQLRDLLWTLIYCTSITKAAKSSLSVFIPKSFPEYEVEENERERP